MQVELSIRYHFNSKDWTKLKGQTIMNIVQDMKQYDIMYFGQEMV